MDENSPVFYSEHCPLWVHPIYLSNFDLIFFSNSREICLYLNQSWTANPKETMSYRAQERISVHL